MCSRKPPRPSTLRRNPSSSAKPTNALNAKPATDRLTSCRYATKLPVTVPTSWRMPLSTSSPNCSPRSRAKIHRDAPVSTLASQLTRSHAERVRSCIVHLGTRMPPATAARMPCSFCGPAMPYLQKQAGPPGTAQSLKSTGDGRHHRARASLPHLPTALRQRRTRSSRGARVGRTPAQCLPWVPQLGAVLASRRFLSRLSRSTFCPA